MADGELSVYAAKVLKFFGKSAFLEATTSWWSAIGRLEDFLGFNEDVL